MTTIHQHIQWSTDIAAAPRGGMVASKRFVTIKGKPVEQTYETFVPTFIMALTKCGKIVRTYWLPGKEGTLDGDRWSGLNRGEQPLAWATWPDAEWLMSAVEGSKAVNEALNAEPLAHAEEDA